MAVAPRGHRHRGRANNPFFYFTASRMAVAPRGRRHRGRANNPGCAGHAKGRVDVTAATHCNDGGKRALWMLAKRSKMSERSQCQDEGEQRPGDERRANSGGFLRDQQSTANPNLCSAEEIKGRERMQGICMPERHHEPKLVFGRRGSRAQTISTSVCQRGSRNSSSCLAYD